MDETEKILVGNLILKASALCTALEAVCVWTGTDWIGSHSRRAIEETKLAISNLNSLGKE